MKGMGKGFGGQGNARVLHWESIGAAMTFCLNIAVCMLLQTEGLMMWEAHDPAANRPSAPPLLKLRTHHNRRPWLLRT